MNRLSAMMIKGNEDVRCEVAFDKETEKYSGWIMLYKKDSYHTAIVSTNPEFDTKEDALKCVEDIVKKVRSMTSEEIWGPIEERPPPFN